MVAGVGVLVRFVLVVEWFMGVLAYVCYMWLVIGVCVVVSC